MCALKNRGGTSHIQGDNTEVGTHPCYISTSNNLRTLTAWLRIDILLSFFSFRRRGNRNNSYKSPSIFPITGSMGSELSVLTQTSPSIGIFSYIDILDGIHYVSQLNSSRFLKTCRALDVDGDIVVKVFLKPKEGYEIASKVDAVRNESLFLSQLPNVLNYSKIIETDRAGYLVRQHLKRTLYDRLSSRPYLQEIELKFIAFQLLQILKSIHSLGVVHGDIKTENLLVNSWNWVLLTDFSAHIKPAYLPEDNPGDFLFYFDTTGRRNCYVAPERFNTDMYNKNPGGGPPLGEEVDIFSAGCCIAELFSEGSPIFSLSQLFKYKDGKYDVRAYLEERFSKIGGLVDLILDMIALEPFKRLSAAQLLDKYRGIIFPDYFYEFAYDYFRALAILGTRIPKSDRITYPNMMLENYLDMFEEALNRVYKDFFRICQGLNYPNQFETPLSGSLLENGAEDPDATLFFSNNIQVSKENWVKLQKYEAFTDSPALKDEFSLFFISYLAHMLRNLRRSESRIKCLELLTLFSQYVSDENKLDRVLPYIQTCFDDTDPIIQGLAVQCICQILSIIEVVSELNENIFVDYLLPRIKRLLKNSRDKPHVRMVIANTLGNYVTIARKFREISLLNHLSQVQIDLENNLGLRIDYTKKLMQSIQDIVVSLLTDNNSWVKVALLDNILTLCRHFGKEATNDIILSHLITFLNDKNSTLRMALVEKIADISILLGPITTERYILPLLMQTLTDTEEVITISTVKSIRNLCAAKLVSKKNSLDVARELGPLLLHPSYAIHYLVLNTLYQIAQNLSKTECYCNLYPIISPYFEFDIDFTLDSMIDSSIKPISRISYNLLCSWSLRSSNSFFWRELPSNQADSFGNPIARFVTKNDLLTNYRVVSGMQNVGRSRVPKAFMKSTDGEEIPLTAEDKLWVDKFRAIGFQESALWKLIPLRNYVLRLTKNSSGKFDMSSNVQNREGLITKYPLYIETNNVMPRNVFFDTKFTEDNEYDNNEKEREKRLEILPRSIYKERVEPLELPDSDLRNIDSTKEKFPKLLPPVVGTHGPSFLRTKSSATTAQVLENVYIQLEPSLPEGDLGIISAAGEQEAADMTSLPKFIVTNSYEGNTKSIRQFLESVSIVPDLKEYKEYGHVASTDKADSSDTSTDSFKGALIARLTRNIGDTIISLCIFTDSPNPFLVSGSQEGMINIWDFEAILNGDAFSPNVTYDCEAAISDIVEIENYDSFAVATTDGVVSVFRVLSGRKIEGRRFTELKKIRKLSLNDSIGWRPDDYILKLQTFITEEKPLLIGLTRSSKFILIDLRNMKICSSFETPPSHGAVTTFACCKSYFTLVSGTTKGVVDIWDLRFELLINSWTFSSSLPISDLIMYPPLGDNYVLVFGGSDENVILSVWDYIKVQCKYVVLRENSSTLPAMEEFQAIFKNLNELKFSPSEKTIVSLTSAASVLKDNIFVINDVTDCLLSLTLMAPSESRAFAEGGAVSHYTFSTLPMTPNFSYIVMRKRGKTKISERADNPKSLNQLASVLAAAHLNRRTVIVTGDSIGRISVYR